MIWLIGEYLVNVVEVVLLLEFASSLLKKKFVITNSIYAATVILVSSGMMAINYLTEVFAGGPPPGIFFVILTYLLMLSPLLILFKDKITKKAFVLIVFSVLVIATEIISALLIIVFANTDFATLTSSGSHRLIGMVMSKSLLIYIVKSYAMRRIGIRDYKNKQLYFGLILLCVSIILIICLLYFYVNSSDIYPYHRLYIVTSSIAVLLMNYLVMKQVMTVIVQSEEKAASFNAAENYQMQIKFLKNVEENNEKIRILNHDMKNHMISLKTYADASDLSGLGAYMNEMSRNLDSREISSFSTHLSINAVLNNKIEKAKKYGIYVAISIQVPEAIGVEEFDLCALLGNAMDNAIEACQRMAEDGVRTIDINISEKKEMIIIEISNPACSEDVVNLNSRISSKGDKENHGVGLISMRMIVEKYDGEMKHIVKEGRILFFAVLCNKNKKIGEKS